MSPVIFTYFGDLLGIGEAYQRSPEAARNMLDDFYNIVYRRFKGPCRDDMNLKVFLFSDSVLIKGHDCLNAFPHIGNVYIDLLKKGLLIRGGMASGYLEFEPRLQFENLEKNLPVTDVLARAAAIEKSLKGARCAIETVLAQEILFHNPDWLTAQGYNTNINPAIPEDDILRRIAPAVDANCHEFLYLWPIINQKREMTNIQRILQAISEETGEIGQKQYSETLKMINRTKKRREHTAQSLSQGQ